MSSHSICLLLVLLLVGSRFHGPSAVDAESPISFIDGFVRLDGERMTELELHRWWRHSGVLGDVR